MKNTVKVKAILIALACFFSNAAFAADWTHKDSDDSQDIIDFINTSKVSIDGIQVVLSRGGTFHAWVRQGDNSGNRYELKKTSWHNEFSRTIETFLETKSIIFVGFRGSKPMELWYIEKI